MSSPVYRIAKSLLTWIFAFYLQSGECCLTVNISFGEEHNTYNTTSDADCSSKISVDSAQSKLIVANAETDGSYCMILWACSESTENVHTLCDQRKVSKEQNDWIQNQYHQMGLKTIKDEQSTDDYKGGKCFNNGIQNILNIINNILAELSLIKRK